MCGFLAEFNSNGQLTDQSKFKQILDKSILRGPDSQGYWSNQNNVQLGFNRLAIVDLSETGRQPMHSHQRNFAIVFNGEIYNHLELRKQLRFSNFQGTSDSETISACLEEWGVVKTVESLNGMFALCIYDKLKEDLYLARDFAGIKPLFYGWNGKSLVAASQYNQITAHPVFSSKSVDPKVLKLYLEQHYMPAPFGLYQDTFQVLPGEIVHFTNQGKVNKIRYWELPKEDKSTITNREEALQLIEENLDDSVKRQLMADVPLGAFISGGVDSTLVCSSIKRNNFDLKAYTIGSDSNKHDESERAKQFADALKIKHSIWHLDAKESLKYWEEAMSSLHEPMADFSILPTFLVSKAAKKEVTVALSGDGGDELFFGYERFWSVGKNIKFQAFPKLIRQGIYAADRATFNKKFVNEVLLNDFQSKAHQGLHSRMRSKDLQRLAPSLSEVNLPEEYNVYNYENTGNIRDLLSKMRHAEFYGMMQKTLRKVDLASMGNSLEVRVPFLDKKMIETAIQIDPLLSYGGGRQKQLLKDVLHKRIPQVPEESVKKGFSVPLTGWLRSDLQPKFEEVLLSDRATNFDLNKKHIENMLTAHTKGEADYKWPLFTLYALLK
ncbi:asparagine synthase (glutamine-hydrolyzing) [Mesonia ostreae]|uniref:asparagine synthase (glutamine-hydrolyzing) n=1 Tax=Mesonia ostreae TaxID=861110 RepID=A0ABU2KM84_9FLAO|nr:asparagine synthase (glutamine-hydrolyzing) [Mesonia ostreae]MDT0295734.1 asparagine synthase (glutamine-hydrolyzing) [Mesonia ostreae]